MQSNSTGVIYFYNIGTSSVGTVDTNIPKNQSFSFFFKFNTYYLLQSYGLIELSFAANLNKVSFVSVVSPLPYNTYYLVFGTNIDVVYIPRTPYVYKVGKCLNQSIYDGTSTCVEYTCQC